MRTLSVAALNLFAFTTLTAGAAEHATMTYKNVGDRALQAHIVSPDGHSSSTEAPAVVFFHGGGWRVGSPETGFAYAEALAEHGVVTVAVEYRLTDVATLDDIIRDATSAVRWTRENAGQLGIDTGKIVSFGHSAGGHLAGATAMLSGFDEAGENAHVSSRPNALALLAPYPASVETAGEHLPSGASVGDYEPRLHLRGDAPPSLIIQGSEDELVLPAVSAAYQEALENAGANATLSMVEGVDHYFRADAEKAQVSERLVRFLAELGYIE